MLWQHGPMRFSFIPLFLIGIASTASAETPLSAAEFDEYTRGKTMFYAADGARYGAEQYLRNQRVRWSFLDGDCKEGSWYQSGADICFVYEDDPNPQCWQFFLEPGGLSAQFTGEGGGDVLYEVGSEGEKMQCLGPKVGA